MGAIKLSRLESLARAATDGPWKRDSSGFHCIVDRSGYEIATVCGINNDDPKATADFIAAASPDVVLALIEALRSQSSGGK